MPRKTAKISDIRAYANAYLTGSDDDLIGFRQGVCAMVEHITMDAGDYHGYNDLVQRWGEDGHYIRHQPETYRRWYYGSVTGEYAARAEKSAKAFRDRYKAEHPDPSWDYSPNEATHSLHLVQFRD